MSRCYCNFAEQNCYSNLTSYRKKLLLGQHFGSKADRKMYFGLKFVAVRLALEKLSWRITFVILKACEIHKSENVGENLNSSYIDALFTAGGSSCVQFRTVFSVLVAKYCLVFYVSLSGRRFYIFSAEDFPCASCTIFKSRPLLELDGNNNKENKFLFLHEQILKNNSLSTCAVTESKNYIRTRSNAFRTMI